VLHRNSSNCGVYLMSSTDQGKHAQSESDAARNAYAICRGSPQSGVVDIVYVATSDSTSCQLDVSAAVRPP